MTTPPVISYYNPKAELEIQCDASQTGLGAALLQRGRPIAYTSRVLTETERWYTQIEKEMLAIVFSLEKIPSVHLWMPHENTKQPQATRIHLTEASRECIKMTTEYDVEASEIRLQGAVWTRWEPPLSWHPFQSIPADRRPSYWSWIWAYQHSNISHRVYFKTPRDPTGYWEWWSIAHPQEHHSTRTARTPWSSAITDNALLQHERRTSHTRRVYFLWTRNRRSCQLTTGHKAKTTCITPCTVWLPWMFDQWQWPAVHLIWVRQVC